MKKQTSKKARSKTPLAKSQKLNDMIFAGHHCQQLPILPHVHPKKLRESSPRVCTLQTLNSKKKPENSLALRQPLTLMKKLSVFPDLYLACLDDPSPSARLSKKGSYCPFSRRVFFLMLRNSRLSARLKALCLRSLRILRPRQAQLVCPLSLSILPLFAFFKADRAF